MEKFDLGLAYVWEFDDDFIDMIERILHDSNLSTFRVNEHNIFETTDRIQNKDLYFNFYLDRAADVDEDFENLGGILSRKKTHIFNPYKKINHATDKASMHLEFINAGLHVPYSIIIPPHSESEDILISLDDLAILGRPFIIKPCNTTGGGIGVVTGAETLKEVIEERANNHDDKYILQKKIYPSMIENKRAWFRCFWAFGKSIVTWWDDRTHIYQEISDYELKEYKLNKLKSITKTISKICELDFFSTEIVLTEDNQFIVIDYVNDQCDMRIKSQHKDGVPDKIVEQIIINLKEKIIDLKKSA